MKTKPDAEAFQKMASRLRENSRQWDTLNFQWDELIAQVEADIRNSSLTRYRLRSTQKTTKSE